MAKTLSARPLSPMIPPPLSSPVVGTIVPLVNDAPERGATDAAPDGAAALCAAADALNKLCAVLAGVVSALQGKTLPVAAPTHLRHPATECPATVVEAVNSFLIAKAKVQKSDRYLRAMKNSLSKFAKGRGAVLMDDVTVGELERWLDKPEWTGTTRRGYLRDVRTLYNFTIRRSQARHNPARVVELPASSAGAIQIHTPAQVRAVLNAARAHDLNVMRALAVRYFSGVRSAECDRLTEDCIRTDTGFIEVTAQNAKTRARRLIPIEANLRAWLKLGGVLPLGDSGNRLRLFFKTLDAPWPHNVTRHSFVSYHMARGQNAAKTALVAGNSEDMIFRHYRAVVSKATAREFFALLPE